LDIRKPKEQKRGNQWLSLFYASGGSYKGVRGGKARRRYAHPPPIRSNSYSGSGAGGAKV